MTQMNLMSFKDVKAFRVKHPRKHRLGRNLELLTCQEFHTNEVKYYAIVYYYTEIVTFHANGRITLRSGGYKTRSTKDRINDHITDRVSQKNFEWFVTDQKGRTVRFTEGITRLRSGRWVEADDRALKERKQKNDGNIDLTK